jgi:hypothetical protein
MEARRSLKTQQHAHLMASLPSVCPGFVMPAALPSAGRQKEIKKYQQY